MILNFIIVFIYSFIIILFSIIVNKIIFFNNKKIIHISNLINRFSNYFLIFIFIYYFLNIFFINFTNLKNIFIYIFLFILCLLIGQIIKIILKIKIKSYRPIYINKFKNIENLSILEKNKIYSFPSGHTILIHNIISISLILNKYIKINIVFIILLYIISFFFILNRIICKMHRSIDIIFGVIIGFLITFLLYLLI